MLPKPSRNPKTKKEDDFLTWDEILYMWSQKAENWLFPDLLHFFVGVRPLGLL